MQRSLQAVAGVREEVLAKKTLAETEILLAQRHLEAAKAAGVQSMALKEQGIATERLAAAQARHRAIIGELAVLGKQQASINTKLAASSDALIAGQQRVAASMTALQRAGKGLFTLIGGWPTIAIAAAYGLYKLWDAMAAGDEQAKKSTETLRDYNETVKERLRLEGLQSQFGVDQSGARGLARFQDAVAGIDRMRESIAQAESQL